MMQKFEKEMQLQERQQAMPLDSSWHGWDTKRAVQYALQNINKARQRLRGPVRRADKELIDEFLAEAARQCIWASKGVQRLGEYEPTPKNPRGGLPSADRFLDGQEGE